ncbi:MAG: rRNA pseudouridine synthase [Gammaproteobacteria bacterium]|nr:rRNA pseudouridine synthase [Gammaproteobacteria bacterium]
MRSRAPRRKAAAPVGRVQKVLAAAGAGSRREIERWIRDGRLKINGAVPALGASLVPGDRVTLDGRPMRFRTESPRAARVLLYHRSPGDPLDLKEAASRSPDRLRLSRAGGRWLAIQPLPPVDGGLEILTDDGAWAHRVSRGAHRLEQDYLLRLRGPLDEARVAEFLVATDCEGERMEILAATPQYGEGVNHWLTVTVRATRPASVRHWWGARGFVVSRLMRVRVGPVRLGRELPRGHSRPMTAGERDALLAAITDEPRADLATAQVAEGLSDRASPTPPAAPTVRRNNAR